MNYIFIPDSDNIPVKSAVDAVLFYKFTEKHDLPFVFDSVKFPESARIIKWLGIIWQSPDSGENYTRWESAKTLDDMREVKALREEGFVPEAFYRAAKKHISVDISNQEAISEMDEDDLVELLFPFLKLHTKEQKIDREELLKILITEKRNKRTLKELAETTAACFL